MKLKFKIIFVVITFIYLSGCTTDFKKEFYPNGMLKEEVSSRNGKFNGNYKAFYENGIQQATGKYSNGEMIGVWQYYYPNGSIQSIQKFNDGIIVSLDYWDINGVQVIKNGSGVAKHYYPNGQIESVMSYKDNVFHGKCETWFSNGIKATELIYEDGKPIGTWNYWNEKGELIKTEKY